MIAAGHLVFLRDEMESVLLYNEKNLVFSYIDVSKLHINTQAWHRFARLFFTWRWWESNFRPFYFESINHSAMACTLTCFARNTDSTSVRSTIPPKSSPNTPDEWCDYLVSSLLHKEIKIKPMIKQHSHAIKHSHIIGRDRAHHLGSMWVMYDEQKVQRTWYARP